MIIERLCVSEALEGSIAGIVHHRGTEKHRGTAATKRIFTTEPRRRRTSAFIGKRNSGAGLWQTGMASGGKLWSKSVLVPSCPPQSLTSVVAIHCLVARCPAKGALDPVGEFAFS